MGACIRRVPSRDPTNRRGDERHARRDDATSISPGWPKCPVHCRNGLCPAQSIGLRFVLVNQRRIIASMEPFMSQYRRSLPQLADRNFITDGGLETTLIYHDGIDL